MLEQIAEKMRALKTVIVAVEKQFGKGAVMTLGAVVGGFFAAHYAQRVPQTWIRAFVIIVGSAMTVYFFARAYL